MLWRLLTDRVFGDRTKSRQATHRRKSAGRRLRIEPLESRQLLSGDFFVVPGALGADVAVEFHWVSRDAKFNNEIGVMKVADSAGTVLGLAPGNSSYEFMALATGKTVFASGQGSGASQVLTFKGGDRLAFFLVQDGTRDAAFAALGNGGAGPKVFFSTDGANGDGVDHCIATTTGMGMQFAFEDQTGGGDRDCNDAVIMVGTPGAFVAPGAATQSVDAVIKLLSRDTAFANEIGMYYVDDARGAVGNLLPGDANYAAAALGSSSRRVLFTGGAAEGQSTTVNVPGGKTLAFYLVADGTSANALSQNPRNLTTGTTHVFFSLPRANPDGKAHVRSAGEATLGFEDQLGGGDGDFNDAVIKVSFGTPVGPLDTTKPTVSAALVTDTSDPSRSATASDRISSNATVSGTVSDNIGVVQLSAGFDNQAVSAYGDVTSLIDANRAFRLDSAKIHSLYGGTLTNGSHTLHLRAKDAAGNTTQFDLQFVYDTLHAATVRLGAASDTGTQGESRTDAATVTLVGTAEANATVRLVRIETNLSQTTLATTTADASGAYQFTGVSLAAGPNGLKVFATDAAGNVAETGATITRNLAPTVSQAIGSVVVDQGDPDSVFDLRNVFADGDTNTVVRIDTSLGAFDVQLFNTRTPGHATNFLSYANAGQYDDTFFHRLASGFVLQGGGYEYKPGQTPNYTAVTDHAAVTNEPGLPNSKGTLALAKLANQASSGTSEWFVNLADNVSNLDNQNGGFTVFGQVLRNGQQVIDAIEDVQTYYLDSTFNSIPLRNFTGNQMQQATANNLMLINSVTTVANVSYSVVSNSNPSLLTATITNNNLYLHYLAGQTGAATITLRATDTDGTTVDHTFSVQVNAAGG